jgi:D-3-phosphoglycerate dehydrogenase
MPSGRHFQHFRVARLNATLFPIGEFEAELHRRYQLEVVPIEDHPLETSIGRLADISAVFVISADLPRAVVESLSRCRVISRLGAGTDKIDVEAATSHGIVVTNVPDFCVEEQADHTMALLLALARKLPQMAQAVADGAWSRSKRQASTNQRLSGQVLGLIGFGYSARAVARRARAFGFRVIATRRNQIALRDVADELGVEMVSLDRLLAESDHVSLHLPLTTETYHLLDEAALRRMKRSATLINTSRGAIVDEMALVDALREGRLAGAGLDTFEGINPFSEIEGPPDHPLVTMDKVILTPHVAAYSVQASQDVSRGGVRNVVSVLSGHWPLSENIVNQAVIPRFPLAAYDPSLLHDEPGHMEGCS